MTRTRHGDRLRHALHDGHLRSHGRGRILDGIATSVIIAQADGEQVALIPQGRGAQSWVLTFNDRTYYLRIRAGAGAPVEDGVIYLLNAYRGARVVAEFRNREDVINWFDSKRGPALDGEGDALAADVAAGAR